MENSKKHWENIYNEKSDNEVSWFQENPKTSLSLINKYSSNQKNLSIVDVGGGNSMLSIKLAEQGFENLCVLDISKAALNRNQKRNALVNITWMEANILDYNTIGNIDIWHDRAVFHFLTDNKDIQKYVSIASKSIMNNGYLIIGTFSESGPEKCSGLPITQYSEKKFKELFELSFELVECFEKNHITPFDSVQNFIWVVFRKRQ